MYPARSLALLAGGQLRAFVLLAGGLLRCGPLQEPLAGSCGGLAVEIGQLQGTGSVSPRQDERATVEGVVTLVTPEAEPPGFYLQSTHAGDLGGSDGLFAQASKDALWSLHPGQLARVRGRVTELDGTTALSELELIEPCGVEKLEPLAVALGDADQAERWESMLVESEETWTLIDSSQLESADRVLVSAHGRSYGAGHPLGPPRPRWALSGLGAELGGWLRAGLVSEHLRLGARVHGLSALVQAGSPPLLVATVPLAFDAPRTPAPAQRPPATVRVVALNLDNYFSQPGSRGARSATELERQRAKLVTLLQQLDADILALSELGNAEFVDGTGGAGASLAELLDALDAAAPGEPAYRVSESAASPGGVLRAAIAYRTRLLQPAGQAWFAADAAFRRAPLLQRFESASGAFTLAVVHLKSKVCSGAAEIVGPEGCGAEQRLSEARALLRVLSALPADEAERALVIGDFNADVLEAPLLELRSGGLVDLLSGLPPSERYTYVFEGSASQLDHALAGTALAARLRGAHIWHINADEPALLGYELAHAARAYSRDARRSSDHDPIVVDLAP
jgi:predicted extracellular nuclease